MHQTPIFCFGQEILALTYASSFLLMFFCKPIQRRRCSERMKNAALIDVLPIQETSAHFELS